MPDTPQRRRPYILGVILVVAMYAGFGTYDIYRHERSERDRTATRERLNVEEIALRLVNEDRAALRAEIDQLRERVVRLEAAGK